MGRQFWASHSPSTVFNTWLRAKQMANNQSVDELWNLVLDLRESPKCTPLYGSEPSKRGLTVRQGRGTVAVPHGRQHGSNIRHRSIQLIRRRTVNVS
jgi:hypothetical protein